VGVPVGALMQFAKHPALVFVHVPSWHCVDCPPPVAVYMPLHPVTVHVLEWVVVPVLQPDPAMVLICPLFFSVVVEQPAKHPALELLQDPSVHVVD